MTDDRKRGTGGSVRHLCGGIGTSHRCPSKAMPRLHSSSQFLISVAVLALVPVVVASIARRRESGCTSHNDPANTRGNLLCPLPRLGSARKSQLATRNSLAACTADRWFILQSRRPRLLPMRATASERARGRAVYGRAKWLASRGHRTENRPNPSSQRWCIQYTVLVRWARHRRQIPPSAPWSWPAD